MNDHADSGDLPFFVIDDSTRESVVLARKTFSAGAGEYIISGRCMIPTLLPGDELELADVDGTVRVGWVVTFAWEDKLLTHRVIRVKDGFFWARGDVSDDIQGPVALGDVVGRVVACHRNGIGHSIEGEQGRLLGLAYNFAMARTITVARKFPRLRKLVEIELLSSKPARFLAARAGDLFFGEISVEEVVDRAKILSVLMTSNPNVVYEEAQNVEKRLDDGLLRLLVARSSRRGLEFGSVILDQLELPDFGAVGYIGNLMVDFWFRGMDVERLLVEAVERVAMSMKISRLLTAVSPANVRLLDLYRSMGFRQIDGDAVPGWLETKSDSLLPGRIILEKRIEK